MVWQTSGYDSHGCEIRLQLMTCKDPARPQIMAWGVGAGTRLEGGGPPAEALRRRCRPALGLGAPLQVLSLKEQGCIWAPCG